MFNLNQKLNTTILIPSNYNFKEDAYAYINDPKSYTIVLSNYGSLNNISKPLLTLFNVEYLLEKEELTKQDYIIINILNNIKSGYQKIIFFDTLTYLPTSFKKQLIAYLKKQNIQIINYTSNIEETLLLEYLIIIYNQSIIMEGLTCDILKEEQILKKLGYNLPFIVELSIGLKYYGLISQIYYDNEGLGDALWK